MAIKPFNRFYAIGGGGENMQNLPRFSYWCQKIMPLVYTDDISYYEIQQKIASYINSLIDDTNNVVNEVEELKKELAIVQTWIDTFNTSFIEQEIKKYISTMIFVEINQNGYIVYNIPENWSDIEFNTTGADISLELQPEYGHLVLSY